MNKYEQLIEHIINDETGKARELFHNIVVEKSRDIYESLIDETDIQGIADEVAIDEQGISEEEEELEGGDDALDFDDQGQEDEFGGEEAGEENIEDRVMDLEDALDELKAEFDALMADEQHEPEHHDGIDDPDFGGEEEVGAEEAPEEFYEAEECDDEEEDEEEEVEESIVREYVEKVSTPANTEGGEVGAKGSANVNKQSTVAGKNDMGGSSANIAKGGANQNPDGTSPKGATKPKANVPHAGNFENVPGAKAGNAFAKKEGAVKKEEGAVNKTTPTAK